MACEQLPCEFMSATVDRKDTAKLVEFSVQCFNDLAVSLGTLLQIELCAEQTSSRNVSKAKKHKEWDLRCPTLWNFVDLWSTRAGGLKGLADALHINKDKLGRYHRNCDQKNCTLESTAVINVESDIIRFVVHSSKQCAQQQPCAIAVSTSSKHSIVPTRITPLYLHSISGGGIASIHALGEAVDRPEWVLKTQRADKILPIRRGMQDGRSLGG
jgi:hypothetical protein